MPGENQNFVVWLRAYTFISIGGVLVTFFLASIIQGILTQLSGNIFQAIALYLLSWFCLGTGVMLFLKGKKLVHLVMIS